ncbi:hypothetical protein LPJ61_006668, partial [Coemansia biformis]
SSSTSSMWERRPFAPTASPTSSATSWRRTLSGPRRSHVFSRISCRDCCSATLPTACTGASSAGTRSFTRQTPSGRTRQPIRCGAAPAHSS